jgi:hypothetical protein
MVALALGLAMVCGPNVASAANERSSPEDLRRFVEVVRSLEQAPLNESLQGDRAWALEWLTNAPDVTVTACSEPLGGIAVSDYKHRSEIVVQDIFSMAAFAIEHPEKANDPDAQQLAGVEGALKAYRSILRDKPKAKSSILDNLLQTQTQGGLPDHVRRALVRCSKEK